MEANKQQLIEIKALRKRIAELEELEVEYRKMLKTQKELKTKIRELESFDRHAVERELKIIELKKEINSLLEKAGEPKKYMTYL